MPTLATYRDYDDHDVLQNFKWSGTVPVVKGTFVKIISGVMTNQNAIMLGALGNAWGNTVSQRYGIQPQVGQCDASGDAALGMLLYDVREVDENNIPLVWNKEKQDQMQAVLSGEPAPVVTRGIFVYSGVSGTAVAGGNAYLNSDGGLQYGGAIAPTNTATKVGKFLGPPDANGFVYLKLEL